MHFLAGGEATLAVPDRVERFPQAEQYAGIARLGLEYLRVLFADPQACNTGITCQRKARTFIVTFRHPSLTPVCMRSREERARLHRELGTLQVTGRFTNHPVHRAHAANDTDIVPAHRLTAYPTLFPGHRRDKAVEVHHPVIRLTLGPRNKLGNREPPVIDR